ncbi:C45 family autoproteolytic acyltransferase/hydolase [Patulibacter americanus]|uniref:C45 family autoproteolytic acyltransferase/hydolase n=1 Tax=Patulibacter americanus TaxID=588672 RepID=UPI0003B48626|nr:C45 family peptidase [Patulibacter americanus]
MALPVFFSTATDPGARGRELGRAHRGGIRATWEGYDALFGASGAAPAVVRRVAGEALERTAAWAPQLAEEIAGIAAGASLDVWRIGALNARTEILAAVGAASRAECSTFVALDPSGQAPRTVQTWDWHDHLRGSMLAVRLEPRPGHHVHLFTEMGIVGKLGVNGAGLGLHFNILAHADDGGPTGVPVHVVARRILDEATTIDEATALAASAPVSASTVLTVVAFDGTRSAVRGLELSPAGLAILEPDAEGVFAHTNHFLDAELSRSERHGPDDPGTYGRLDELVRRTPELRAADDPTARATALLDHREDRMLCCHPERGAQAGDRWETLVTAALDLDARELLLHEGGPCRVGDGGWIRI